PVRAAHLFQQCASALSAAHRAGVIHRDLKPDNVFIADPGDREFVKLLDFGVAKMAGAGRLTRAGMVYGTPHYMSPEQAAGQACDARADVYALGVIMYECFAGRVPFEADTYMGVLTQHLFAVPTPIETVSPSTLRLGALGMLIMRCLAKKPEDRYASMDEVADAITRAVEDPREAARAALGGAEPKGGFRLRESNPAPVARSSEPSPTPGVAPRRGLVVGGVIALGLVIGAFALVRGPHGGPTTAGSATGAQVEAPAAKLETPSPSAEPSAAPVASASAPSVEAPSASPANSGKAPTTAPRSPPGVPSPRPPRKEGKHKGEVVDPWAN
ncbi:MAG TPA: serine/threonine-protein kinase, partial [Polyangiaceae bacterium]